MAHAPIVEDVSSAAYAHLRERFLDRALGVGADVSSITHPLAGVDGEELAADCALLGSETATKWLVLLSGVHGAELAAGSAIQCDALRRAPSGDVAVLLVHALNPWGASFHTRQDHEWVDVNRNFRDHSEASPKNDGYAELHPMLLVDDIGDDFEQKSAQLRSWMHERGELELRTRLGRGQHEHPDGFNFGGRRPSWSNRVLRRVLRRLSHAGRVVVIDLHTGLGTFGAGMVLATDAAAARARDIFDEAQSLGGESVAYPARGTVLDAVTEELVSPTRDVCAVTLEFGTRSRLDCLRAQMASSFVHRRGLGAQSSEARGAREMMRDAYAPDSDEWREAVRRRGQEVIEQALAALED